MSGRCLFCYASGSNFGCPLQARSVKHQHLPSFERHQPFIRHLPQGAPYNFSYRPCSGSKL